MTDQRGIVWLASYPKSGNTWTRLFLANYLVNGEAPFPINQAHRFAMGDSAVNTYDAVAGSPVQSRNVDQILALRPKVLRAIIANGADVNFVKTHNKLGLVNGQELIPKQFTRSAVYIVRNPLDVLVSYARHFGRTHEQVAWSLSKSDHGIVPNETMVSQYLGRWDEHVSGWARAGDFPTLILRYEDLLIDPAPHFEKLLKHIGIPVQKERLEKAIRFSSFKELSDQEKRGEFIEKSQFSDAFFNSGTSGKWKEELDPALVNKIRKDHRKVMKKYGYLDE